MQQLRSGRNTHTKCKTAMGKKNQHKIKINGIEGNFERIPQNSED